MGDVPGQEVSSKRLYLGNLPQNVTKAQIEEHFAGHGAGEITEVKLMNGFGFIEYKDAMDARDVVPAYHGSDLNGNRLVVQFARGGRSRTNEVPYHQERPTPRTRRTVYRMSITGLAPDTSWQDLKDFAREDGLDVVYSEVSRERDGKGFVEYETEADLKAAVEKIDGREFKGQTVQCTADIQRERPRERRSRSPPPRRGGYGPPRDYDPYYEQRGPPPPRGYSPRGYRDRSPPPRRDYYERDRYGRSPPPTRARPPLDDGYGPPPRRYPEEPYPPQPRGGGGGYPPRPPYEADPYMNGGSRGAYERPPSPSRRPRSPGGRGGYDQGYDRRYW